MKVPAGYLDRPELDSEYAFTWDAFSALSSDRSAGMGEGAIPFTAIDRFAQRYGIDDLDEFDRFRSLISALDREYLGIRAEQSKKDDGPVSKEKPV
jgi:hypothetical protein